VRGTRPRILFIRREQKKEGTVWRDEGVYSPPEEKFAGTAENGRYKGSQGGLEGKKVQTNHLWGRKWGGVRGNSRQGKKNKKAEDCLEVKEYNLVIERERRHHPLKPLVRTRLNEKGFRGKRKRKERKTRTVLSGEKKKLKGKTVTKEGGGSMTERMLGDGKRERKPGSWL